MKRNGPKQKPPVEVVEDPKTGVVVTIFYDRQCGDFYGDIKELGRIRKPTGPECVAEIKKLLRECRSFDWKPVIVIAHGSGLVGVTRMLRTRSQTTEGASLSFSFYRIEIAPKPGDREKFVERRHPGDIEEALPSHRHIMERSRREGADVCDHWVCKDENTFHIPYTEEARSALRRIKTATEATHEKLRELFKTPELLVAAKDLPLLLPPKEKS